MKDHPDRKRRLQLIEAMFAGHSWQEALAQSQLHISRATAYRLRQLARDEDKAGLVFLDDRHGHPYKLSEPARTWLAELCTTHPQLASSRVQAELQTTFGVTVSVSQINRVRAKLGISTQRRGQIQGQTKKN
jgi:putative transposase